MNEDRFSTSGSSNNPVNKDQTHLHARQTHSSRARTSRNSSERQDFADSLDLVLNTCYDHSSDLFVSKSEVHIQRESGPRGSKLCQRPNSILCHSKNQASAYHTTGVFLGGIHERGSPYSVKLINIGQHTPLTNPGYSRQTSDGNFFNY